MAGPYLQLVYTSSSPELMTDEDLAAILRVSRRNNQAAGVTGALLYADGTFMQALEGAPEAVEATYSRVCLDPRHRGATVMLRAHSEQRSFEDWAMGFRRVDALPVEDQHAARSPSALTEAGPDRVHRLMASFRAFLPGVRTHVPMR